MAAGSDEHQRRRKRKKVDQQRPKLLPDEKVEVRSLEEGFLGSWHCATVIRSDSLVREVRYDHLLCDDGSSNLTECVNVTPVIDGSDVSDCLLDCHRGLIRPSPPSLDFGLWSLHYGLCVDMNLDDAWWEGVVFDHEDGSGERKIFFPDMGDEMKAKMDTLRITQDWDEMTEKWKPRGKWLFLELIEQIEQEWPVLVSVKQIWYEVRMKKCFELLKEWTSSARDDIWRKLILEVLSDNFKLTIKHIFHEFNSSGDLVQGGRLLRLSEPALDAVLKPDVIFGNSLDFSPSRSSDKLNSVEMIGTSMRCHQGRSQSPPLLITLPNNPDQLLDINCNKNGEGFSARSPNTCKVLRQSSRIEWVPVGPDMVPGPACCPVAIALYCKEFKNRKPRKIFTSNARRHLLYLGWKIEFGIDGSMIRMRYLSPEGKYYYSLIRICEALEAREGIQPLVNQDDSGSLSLCHLDDPKSLSLVIQDGCKSSTRTREGCASSTIKRKPKRFRKSKFVSHYRDLSVKPEYCPRAVKDYLDGVKDAFLKARKHLAAVGWSFGVHCKSIATGRGMKKEIRYYSPSGKMFYSLKTACDWYDKDAGLMTDDSHASEKSHVSEDPIGLLAVNGQPCPSIDLRSLEGATVQSDDDLLENLQSESPPGMLLQEEPLQKAKTQVSGNRKFRKKKSKSCHALQTTDQNDGSLSVVGGQGPVPLVKVGDDTDATSSTHVLQLSKRARQAGSACQTPRSVLSWLIENNEVLPRAKVQYRWGKDGRIMAEGRITREGIKCCCCQNVYTLSNFEAHAGSTKHRPSANIFLEDGRSLFECQLKMKSDKKLSSAKQEPREIKSNRNHRRNDYICSVCHYGGELVLCDQCPSSFHASCLGMKEIPDGDWFCPSCCCGICGQSRFDKNIEQLTDNRVVSCSQCEHQYHFGCLRDKGLLQSNNYPVGDWLCNEKCQQIFQGLRKLLGKPIPVGIDNLTWTLLKFIESKGGEHDELYDESVMETYSKLNVALGVMHECFEPVKEPRTRRDIVEDVIFSRGSELHRLNFQGFYTVLLERNDELITVANVRVYGEKVAEIPLVGTRFRYRRHGMCRILMDVLEKKLMELGVERLVLPAVPSVLNTWTTAFGFSKMNETERSNYLDCTFLDFQGTVMCQKLLKEKPSSDVDQSTGTQQKSVGHTNTSSNMDLDCGAVPEVLPPNQLEESEQDGQGSASEAGEHGSNPENVSSPVGIEANQPENVSSENGDDPDNVSSDMDIEANQPHLFDCSVEVADHKEDDNSCNGLFKCYKRRRISAC